MSGLRIAMYLLIGVGVAIGADRNDDDTLWQRFLCALGWPAVVAMLITNKLVR